MAERDGLELKSLKYLLHALKNLALWEHMACLSNPSSGLSKEQLDFDLFHKGEKLSNRAITLKYGKDSIPFEIKCANRTGRHLFFYGIHVWPDYRVSCTSKFTGLIKADDTVPKLLWDPKFFLPDENHALGHFDHARNIYQLFVSEEDLDADIFEVSRPKKDAKRGSRFMAEEEGEGVAKFVEETKLFSDWRVFRLQVDLVRESSREESVH